MVATLESVCQAGFHVEIPSAQYGEKAMKITLDVETSKKNSSDDTVRENLV